MRQIASHLFPTTLLESTRVSIKDSRRALARQVIEIKQLVLKIARWKRFDVVNTELGMRNFCWRQSPQ
jgi:hypothetical protein